MSGEVIVVKQTVQQRSPYELLGGEATVAAIVDHFYDLMEQDPAYADLRALHAPDLSPMRGALKGFLSGWMGGPRGWFEQNPGKCIVSAHTQVNVTNNTVKQWVSAMSCAVKNANVDDELAGKLIDTFIGMATSMARD